MLRCLAAATAVLAAAVTASCGASSSDSNTVTWATIAGFYTDAAEKLTKKFEDRTGIKVKIVEIDYAQMFDKEVVEMTGRTGAYDVVTIESTWKGQWAKAGYIQPLDKYVKKSPEKVRLDDIAPALASASTMWDGKVVALPYYTYTQGLFYRCDLFENPAEKQAFQQRYGYELAAPKTWDQHRDIAEFFRREKGEKLKGQTLERDFYGVGLMAGRFDQIQDENAAIAWGLGGDFLDDQGNPTTESGPVYDALQLYLDELKNAPPGALQSSYDQVVGQMNDNQIAMTGGFYLDQWANMIKTEQEVSGAKICAAVPPEGKGYIGAFGLGIANGSKNADNAYKFIEYITGPEAQKEFALAGGTSARLSVIEDKEVNDPQNRELSGHYPTLAKVLKNMKGFETNLFKIDAGAKVYDEMTVWYSSAASKQNPPKEAMSRLAEAIRGACGGPCELFEPGQPTDVVPSSGESASG